MSDQPAEVHCANCGQRLDPGDKFCRECGLPTVRQATERKLVPAAPPDTGELRRALNAAPDPQPFLRAEVPSPSLAGNAGRLSEIGAVSPYTPAPETTGDVVRATSPTQAVQMATSTVVMLGLIIVLVVAALVGIVLLAIALRS